MVWPPDTEDSPRGLDSTISRPEPPPCPPSRERWYGRLVAAAAGASSSHRPRDHFDGNEDAALVGACDVGEHRARRLAIDECVGPVGRLFTALDDCPRPRSEVLYPLEIASQQTDGESGGFQRSSRV